MIDHRDHNELNIMDVDGGTMNSAYVIRNDPVVTNLYKIFIQTYDQYD